MLQVTEQAGHELKRILDDVERESDQTLRLVADDSGNLKLAIDAEREGDQVVEHEGAKVLVIEKAIADQLEGVAMDTEETSQGPKLTLGPQGGSSDKN